jgi:hypothetical protein
MTTEPLGDQTEVVEQTTTRTTRTQKAPPQRRVVAAEPAEPKDTVMALLMAVTAVVLVLGGIVVLGIKDSQKGTTPEMAKKIAGTFRKPGLPG